MSATGFNGNALTGMLAWADRQPGRVAVCDLSQQVTYGELAARTRAAAGWLHTQGVKAGDVAAVRFEAAPHQLGWQDALLYGLAWVGAVILPIYPHAATDGLGALLRRFGARWWVVNGAAPADHVLHGVVPSLATAPIASAGPAQGLPVLTVGQFMVAHQTGRTGHWAASDPDPEAPLLVEFTSGTTGDAKAVLHRHGQYAATFMGSCQAQGSLNGHVTVSAAPWPSKVGMRGCWRMMTIGATHVREPFPQTLAAAQTLIDGVGLNALACSPWQLRVLLREAASAPAGQSNPVRQALVHLSVGGAPVMPQELTEARRLLCANSVEVLAATEVGIIGVNTPDDPPDGRFRLAPGVVAQAVDEGGNPLALGLPGPLRLRTPWMCDGYAQAGAAPNNAFRAGWFHSSDLGRLDADGRLALLGRADDTINTSAIKIQPRELERLLLSHPDIADAAVFAYPDDLLGELPVAFVVLARPTGMKDLHAWLAARLDRWHMPRGLAVAQALPRNADGKVQVAELRERYRQLQTPNRNP